MRELGHRRAAVARIGAQQIAVDVVGGDGRSVSQALGLQHRDWHTGCGDTPYIEVVDRDHPHGVRAKSGYRRVYVSD